MRKVFCVKTDSLESIAKAKGNWRDLFPLPNPYFISVHTFHKGDWIKQLKQTKHRDLATVLREIKEKKYIEESNKELEAYRRDFDKL